MAKPRRPGRPGTALVAWWPAGARRPLAAAIAGIVEPQEMPMSVADSPREAWRLPGTLLPDGERRDLWIAGGRLTDAAVDGAEVLPGRFSLPGIVDAHAHVALDGFTGLSAAGAAANLAGMGHLGVLLVRDLGAPHSVTLEIESRADLPQLLAAGRWLAPDGRFYGELHDPVEPQALIEAALAEVGRGARWVKVVADFREPDLSFPPDLLRDLVGAVHAAGARVAAHVQWAGVADVVAAGVDSIEHGCALDIPLIDAMIRSGAAWTPTLTAFSQPLPEDAPPERRARIRDYLDNVGGLLPVAAARGATILAGTDTAGQVVDEVRHLVAFGLTPVQALRAATTDARTFLGVPGLEAGAPADVVTFDGDPREDPEVLRSPAAVVLGGTRIA
jgi:imidazolonepropionase-like amidohydrolase